MAEALVRTWQEACATNLVGDIGVGKPHPKLGEFGLRPTTRYMSSGQARWQFARKKLPEPWVDLAAHPRSQMAKALQEGRFGDIDSIAITLDDPDFVYMIFEEIRKMKPTPELRALVEGLIRRRDPSALRAAAYIFENKEWASDTGLLRLYIKEAGSAEIQLLNPILLIPETVEDCVNRVLKSEIPSIPKK